LSGRPQARSAATDSQRLLSARVSQNWNIGLFKDFHTTEKQFITFRFERSTAQSPNVGGATGGGLDTDPRDAPSQNYFKDSQRQLQLSLR